MIGNDEKGSTSSDSGYWETYFEEGERLIWQGAPEKRNTFGIMEKLGALMGAVFLGGGLITLAVDVDIFPSATSLGAAVFIGIGLFMIASPWFGERRASLFTRYAISNRRAYIARNFGAKTLQSYSIDTSNPLFLEKGTTSDNIFFRSEHSFDHNGRPFKIQTGFEGIKNGDHVYSILCKLQEGTL